MQEISLNGERESFSLEFVYPIINYLCMFLFLIIFFAGVSVRVLWLRLFRMRQRKYLYFNVHKVFFLFARFDPYGKNKFAICRICKSSVHQPGSHYCQGCAYKKELAFLGCLWMHKLQWRLDPLVPDYQSVIPALDKDRAALLHTFLTSILDHGTFSQQNKGHILAFPSNISRKQKVLPDHPLMNH
uniref:Cysteine-rich PDZ-binding protein n=1 Tax=Anser brachyrhynchus TaxID=132585 RepID=A0A8B9BBV6_9AVES